MKFKVLTCGIVGKKCTMVTRLGWGSLHYYELYTLLLMLIYKNLLTACLWHASWDVVLSRVLDSFLTRATFHPVTFVFLIWFVFCFRIKITGRLCIWSMMHYISHIFTSNVMKWIHENIFLSLCILNFLNFWNC